VQIFADGADKSGMLKQYANPLIEGFHDYGPHLSRKADSADDHQRAGRPAAAVYGRGQNVRDWLFIEDHAEALLEIVSAGRAGESYDIGGGSERRNLEVVDTICDLVDEFDSRERQKASP
jgi:nucleoside-diphosphate-sugar epimerase